jgi:hypothetical protein
MVNTKINNAVDTAKMQPVQMSVSRPGPHRRMEKSTSATPASNMPLRRLKACHGTAMRLKTKKPQTTNSDNTSQIHSQNSMSRL